MLGHARTYMYRLVMLTLITMPPPISLRVQFACLGGKGRPYEGSPMVPTHEVSTPAGFMLDSTSEDEIFTIMPATFEPGKIGPFFISIATDVEFSLRRLVILVICKIHRFADYEHEFVGTFTFASLKVGLKARYTVVPYCSPAAKLPPRAGPTVLFSDLTLGRGCVPAQSRTLFYETQG